MIFMQIHILSFQRIDLVSLLLFTIFTKKLSDSAVFVLCRVDVLF